MRHIKIGESLFRQIEVHSWAAQDCRWSDAPAQGQGEKVFTVTDWTATVGPYLNPASVCWQLLFNESFAPRI